MFKVFTVATLGSYITTNVESDISLLIVFHYCDHCYHCLMVHLTPHEDLPSYAKKGKFINGSCFNMLVTNPFFYNKWVLLLEEKPNGKKQNKVK